MHFIVIKNKLKVKKSYCKLIISQFPDVCNVPWYGAISPTQKFVFLIVILVLCIKCFRIVLYAIEIDIRPPLVSIFSDPV